jgi:uncharacterized circularly permuted ATP-grasp superfamily protein/uncharacterized alpha-E superfamily protein
MNDNAIMTTNATEPTLDRANGGQALHRGLAESYAPRLPASDEMMEPDSSVRAHWRSFISIMDDLGHDEILLRSDHARQIIRENGVTHNVYGEEDGLARPWSLDLLPLLLPQAEWQTVGQSLAQRARLLDALLRDIYGPATSVTSGILPPELVYGNPYFLRSAHGLSLPQNTWVHLYAADLVRSADGRFRVLADRVQAPSGAGYSLENRIVLSRVLPTVFKQCNVMRLAPFFIAMRKMLTSLAPANRENPRIVLLTPGPYNEAYFEHAYLSRYLGYTLVQGNDLTVRDCRVFLKTLSGLRRVDVILRRVDDDFCDPLELYSNSFLGVPGLMQAIREGTVAITNAIGTGVLQSPAFLPFFPALSKHLLGEDLKIDSVPTWWCGQPDALRYVLDNLPKLVIKPALPLKRTAPIFGEQLSADELSQLSARIRARPMDFVAQERETASSAPALVGKLVQSRRFLVRAFLTASDDSYTIMSGGLTRSSGLADSLNVSLQRGAGSKDTWIIADDPVKEVSLLSGAAQPLELDRGGGDLTSRVADDLFWLGRYIQRAENVVRLARSIFARFTDPNSVGSTTALKPLLHELIGWAPALDSDAARQLAIEFFAPADPGGLRASISHLHTLARGLRDRVSVDAWQILHEIDREIPVFDGNFDDDHIPDILELLNRLVLEFLAFSGMAADSMTRGQAWRFLDMGMRIERGIAMARLVRATLVQVSDDEISLLEALLDIADSSLTYRRRYFTRVETAAILDLLVADESNPRSVAFQVAAIEQHLCNLPRESTHPRHNPDLQLAIKLRAALRLADLSAACKPTGKTRDQLKVLLEDILQSFGSISEFISQIYFSHATASGRLLTSEQE